MFLDVPADLLALYDLDPSHMNIFLAFEDQVRLNFGAVFKIVEMDSGQERHSLFFAFLLIYNNKLKEHRNHHKNTRKSSNQSVCSKAYFKNWIP